MAVATGMMRRQCLQNCQTVDAMIELYKKDSKPLPPTPTERITLTRMLDIA